MFDKRKNPRFILCSRFVLDITTSDIKTPLRYPTRQALLTNLREVLSAGAFKTK